MKKLSRKPIYPRDVVDIWYYETPKGLEFVFQPSVVGLTQQFTISYRTLESYLRRRKNEVKK